ncbi:MAG: NAD-dependent epimerase/dehydratase family protein [Candidatus Omnitrophica bacterium]|nr:NAD-dependent epimerase/dehydratase family protein [Candidatus Omnitrophota bacterium]
MEEYKKYYEGKKILVTGGAGAIGSNLVRTLGQLKANLVIILDDLSSSKEWNVPSLSNVLFVKGSILDEIKLKRVFFEKPQIVFHLAAFFANQNSIDHPEADLMVNGLGTLKILEYSVFTGVEKFIYASSGCSIYGSNSPLPLKEEFMSMHLSTPYQITKMLGELYCNFFYHHYGLKIVKTRFFNSYGPGEIPGQYRNVIPNFIYWALQKKVLPITGTGNETRDFTYVGDIVDGLLRAGYFKEAIGEDINLASGKEIKIIELAQIINKFTRNKSGIKFVNKRKWDTKTRLLASVEKAKRLIGYIPKMNFEDGIKETIKWFKDNWENILKSADFGPGISSAVREIYAEKK